jgi:hypothetical protein
MSAMDAAVPLTDEEVDARMSAIGLGAWRSWMLEPLTDKPTDQDRRKKPKRSPPLTDL